MGAVRDGYVCAGLRSRRSNDAITGWSCCRASLIGVELLRMRSGRGARWLTALAIIGVLLLAAGVARLVWVWIRQGASEADPEASVLGVILAAAGAAIAVAAWTGKRRQVEALPATAEQVDLAAATLAGAAREQWTAEAQVRSLDDPEPMPVRWRLIPNLMDHLEVVNPAGLVEFAASSDRIKELVATFRALPRRRLVITGGPGTGKTTLAVQMLLELLPPPGQVPGEPVPALFSLASWNPAAQPRVQDWLTGQLTGIYPALRAVSSDAAAALITQGRVLPILDGLDEVPPERAAAIITALNTTLTGGMILTSRRPEYQTAIADAADRLTGAAVIAPYALTGAQAATYLRHHLPPQPDPFWQTILTVLATNPPSVAAAALRQLASNPLGLWLIRAVYLDPRPQPDPVPLINPAATPHSLRAHLFDQLIPALLASRPPVARRRGHSPDTPQRPRRRRTPHSVHVVLSAVAAHLRDTRTRDWQWWQVPRYTSPTRRDQRQLQTLRGIVCGIPSGIASGIAFGITFGLFAGLSIGLTVGLWGGLVTEPMHIDTRLRGRVPQLIKSVASGLTYGLVVSLALSVGVGLLGGFLVWLMSESVVEVLVALLGGLVVGLAGWLVITLAGGLADGVMDFLENGDIAAHAVSPAYSFRGARIHMAVRGLLGVLLTGALGGLAMGLMDGLPKGLAGFLTFGLMGWLLATQNTPWFMFMIAPIWHARAFSRPWRVMAVLDDCHRIGLLRTVGPAYQFRHAELQDHLAPPACEAGSLQIGGRGPVGGKNG